MEEGLRSSRNKRKTPEKDSKTSKQDLEDDLMEISSPNVNTSRIQSNNTNNVENIGSMEDPSDMMDLYDEEITLEVDESSSLRKFHKIRACIMIYI